MIREYIASAMARAHYEMLEDDQSFYGSIAECNGVWASAATLEECRHQLEEVLEDWLLVGISLRHPLPIIDGIDMNAIYKEPATA